jgi:hypothetical protein
LTHLRLDENKSKGRLSDIFRASILPLHYGSLILGGWHEAARLDHTVERPLGRLYCAAGNFNKIEARESNSFESQFFDARRIVLLNCGR